MCGIVGVVSKAPQIIAPERLQAMTHALEHRGPDASGVWISEDRQVGLGHRRLSILDLSPHGAQPMRSYSGRYMLSYNGEIYNFRDLRDKLVGLGAIFHGESDTEVLLAAFEYWGLEKTLGQLSGMFSIALWDSHSQHIYLVRDRVGIKPFYYSVIGGELVFASELRPIVQWKGSLPSISAQGLTEFLRLGYVPGPLSIFEGIYKLSPGHFLCFKDGQICEHKPFWTYHGAVKTGLENSFTDQQEALNVLETKLKASVKSHMVSDVPLGAFLSGGIDSSTVVALMQAQSQQSVQTFSIGFHDASYNEAVHAKKVAEHLGTHHTELYVTDEDACAVIPSLPDIYDEPFADVSQIPTYLVSKLARKHVTVALSGDGGDELFAGYNRYIFVSNFWKKLQRIPPRLRYILASIITQPSPGSWDKFFQVLQKVMPSSMLPALPGQKMYKIASILPAQSLLELHIRLVSQWISPQLAVSENWFVHKDLWASELSEKLNLSSSMQQTVWDAQTYMVDDILTKVDRASMTVGLEARVPLLDHDVIEFAWRVPQNMKLRNGSGKWILKQLLYKYVPKDLIERPKMGFGVPIDNWLRQSLKDWAGDCLSHQTLKEQGYLNPDVIQNTWKQHLSGKHNSGGPLWTVLMFQHWLNRIKTWL